VGICEDVKGALQWISPCLDSLAQLMEDDDQERIERDGESNFEKDRSKLELSLKSMCTYKIVR
jgi:hypothetical protein